MAKKAELKAVLKLDNAHFIRAIRHAMRVAKSVALQFAKNPVSTSFIAGILSARQAVKLTAGTIEKFGDISVKAFKYAAIGGGIAAAAITAVGLSSIHAASDMEKYVSIFSVLLKSTTAAKTRMKELLYFANDSGLRLTNVAEASRVLETLTQGALSGEKGLRMVANVAKGTGTDFDELAVTIGQAYDELRSGTASGRTLMQLQKLGAITGGQRKHIEGLEGAMKGAEAWKELQKALSRYDGMIQKMSSNWESRMERFIDSIDEAKRQFGAPLMDTLKPTLTALTNTVFGMGEKFHNMGVSLGNGIDYAIKILVGGFSDPESLLSPLKNGLEGILKGAGNLLYAVFSTAVKTVFSAEFFASLGHSFYGLAQIIAGHLMNAFARPVAMLQAGIEWALSRVDRLAKHTELEYATKNADQRTQQYLAYDDPRYGRMAAGGVPISDAERAAAKEKARQEMNAATAHYTRLKGEYDKTPQQAFEEMVKNNMNTNNGNALIAEGEKSLREGVGNIFDKIFKNFKVEDLFGARESFAKMGEGLRKVAKNGDEVLKHAATHNPIKPIAAAMKAIAQQATLAAKLASWAPHSRLMTGSLVAASMAVGINKGMFPGITGPDAKSPGGWKTYWKPGTSLDDPAVRNNPLIRSRERKEMENKRVADLMAAGAKDVRGGSNATAGGFHRVSRGDRKRMQEVQRERIRAATGVERSNQLLEQIQKRFDEFVKE